MTACRNHPDREAPHSCTGCGGPFCDACVVRFEKLLFCEACKARYLAGVDDAPRPGRGGAPAKARREPRARGQGRTTLHWLLGGAALAFSVVFLIVIVAALAGPWQTLSRDRRLASAFDGLVHVGAALERYRTDKGRYPESLDALVPTYLTEIPEDPYAGEPPRYATSPEHRLWSVGPDAEDDRGEEDDLVYAVEPIAGS